MESVNITAARQNLYKLVNEINESHKPIYIKGKNKNAVLISAEDWNAIAETLYLNSIPGMVESILEGAESKEEDLISEDEVKW